MDDGRGAFFKVETAFRGTVNGVQGGDGAKVDGSPSIDVVWEGNRQETELENHGPR